MRLVLLVLLVAFAGCATPEAPPVGQIDGAVLDQLMNPFAGAEVTLVGTGRTDTTNDLGGFTFRDVPVGSYMVKVVIPEIGEDTQGVAIATDLTSRLILQVASPAQSHDYTTHLGHEGRDAFGVPGTECLGCAWHTDLDERRPDHVRLRATWQDQSIDGKSAAPTMAIIELRDENGHLLATLEGRSSLEARLRGEDVPPSADALHVRVVMHPDNPAPHPGFEIATTLDLFYGTEL